MHCPLLLSVSLPLPLSSPDILPLDKIYHLWDTLLLGNCTFPLCVGVAILQQLKGDLLSFDFNECILMFSDLPDVDIQMCIHDAVRIFQSTPPSACVRKHEHIATQPDSIRPEAVSRSNLCTFTILYSMKIIIQLNAFLFVKFPHLQKREPLSLATLKSESCPQISAHDLITLCQLETQALGYGSKPTGEDPSLNPLRAHTPPSPSRKKQRQKAVVVDIRPLEEYPLN